MFTSLLKKTKTNNALSVPTGQSVGHNTFTSTEDVNISKGVTTAKHCFFFCYLNKSNSFWVKVDRSPFTICHVWRLRTQSQEEVSTPVLNVMA